MMKHECTCAKILVVDDSDTNMLVLQSYANAMGVTLDKVDL